MTVRCENCGGDVQKVLYWRDRKFHEGQTFNYFYCGPKCSTEHYEKIAKENQKTNTQTNRKDESQGDYSNRRGYR